MIISPSKNFIFIHLEKCGGTSVESALEPHLEWSDMIIGSTYFGEKIQNIYFEKYGVDKVRNEMLWKHSYAEDIYYFIGPESWKDFKKVAIVRDPVKIITSLYNFSQTISKYHAGRINPSVWGEKIRLEDFPEFFPFTEPYFIEYIRSVIDKNGINGFARNILNKNFSFVRPQTERLALETINKDCFVIDICQLDNKWNELIQSLGFENKIELPKLNVSEKNNEELSPRMVKNIKQHFAIDYQVIPGYTGITW